MQNKIRIYGPQVQHMHELQMMDPVNLCFQFIILYMQSWVFATCKEAKHFCYLQHVKCCHLRKLYWPKVQKYEKDSGTGDHMIRFSCLAFNSSRFPS